MRVAVIDLGTNSVRFDVHQLGPGRKTRLLHREKLMVRLGQGVFLEGKLDRAAVKRTLNAFARFQRVAHRLRADKIIAFGTSALREVADRDEFVQQVRERTGIDVRVITGAEEAKLIAQGVLGGEAKVRGKGRLALLDIGGGSTEISVVRGKELLHSMSFPLGTARLQQLFLKKSPPEAEDLREMRRFVRNTILQETLAARWPQVDRVLGSSGTVRALAKILKQGNQDDVIDREELGSLNRHMAGMTTTELLGVPGMEAKRVDMILAGAVLFEEALSVLGAKRALATEFSLRDGILAEEQNLYLQGKKSHLSLHLDDLYAKAQVFGLDRGYLERVVALGEQLFRKLQRLHQLPAEWLVYLVAALILRDTGESIALAGHEAHSAYIVRHADLPPMEDWELELIEALVLQHEGSKLDNKAVPFAKSKERRQGFLKLLALLRVVDALDSGPETELKLRSVGVAANRVRLSIGGRHLTGLEALNVELKRPLFEKVFGRALEVVLQGS